MLISIREDSWQLAADRWENIFENVFFPFIPQDFSDFHELKTIFDPFFHEFQTIF